MVETILKLYIFAGLVAGVYLMAVLAYEDIVKGPGYKFGYNYKSLFSWVMLAFYALPILNLYTLWATFRWYWTWRIKR